MAFEERLTRRGGHVVEVERLGAEAMRVIALHGGLSAVASDYDEGVASHGGRGLEHLVDPSLVAQQEAVPPGEQGVARHDDGLGGGGTNALLRPDLDLLRRGRNNARSDSVSPDGSADCGGRRGLFLVLGRILDCVVFRPLLVHDPDLHPAPRGIVILRFENLIFLHP